MTVDCPFCSASADRVVFSNSDIIAIWDGFPVTVGHLLLIPRRHVGRWAELTEAEIGALSQAISQAQSELRSRHGVDDFNVGFNDGPAAGQTIPHFHIHVIPRRPGDVSDPRGGVRHVIPDKGNYLRPGHTPSISSRTPHTRTLIAGGEDALLRHLLPHIDDATAVDVAVAFVMSSGVQLLWPHLQDLLDRKGRLRLLTGDYLDATDPFALRRLLDLDGDVDLRVFESRTISFHPKSWIFHFRASPGIAIVGSSNLSETALRTGVEWNYRVVDPSMTAGWRDVLDGFEQLFAHPQVRGLSHSWIDDYAARRSTGQVRVARLTEIPDEPPPVIPFPHDIQVDALNALEQTRRDGFTAGLVVLATGLGKTWLSAFDSNRREFSRVLFVAHRDEILTQAMDTFRKIRPNDTFGRYTGTEKDLTANVLFASIQTLGRVGHLRNFSPDTFDYIIVDEFHHAAARTYRNLIEHFTPQFMLGLTATPDRTDGSDLLALCQENLVFRCDAFEGIGAGLLAKFRYFGVPDNVDYQNIPWRSSNFDEVALTQALATQMRAQNALEQYRLRGGSRTLGFCCSVHHADFMADHFVTNGIKAVAVHSGSSSAPRSTSLEALANGEIDIVFSVDMFNEGVDVPSIDTVLMLRPTESTIVWMQQFGRGLRKTESKEHLTVVDYIGNHRIFLTKARALLQSDAGDRALARALEECLAGRTELPEGCSVTYELEAVDILRKLLRSTEHGDQLEAFYVDFRLRNGVRPTASEVFHAGFNPRATGHGSWFEFVENMNDFTPEDLAVTRRYNDLFVDIGRTPMTKSYKMLVLQAMLQAGELPGSLHVDQLVTRLEAVASRNPRYKADLGDAINNRLKLRRLLVDNPIKAWVEGRGTGGKRYFAFADDQFSTTFTKQSEGNDRLVAMVDELVEWRQAEYLSRSQEPDYDQPADSPLQKAAEPDQPPFVLDRGAELWREYMREEIPPLFGLKFTPGSWNQGFLVQGDDVFLLVTLNKDDMPAQAQYGDRFLDASRLLWHSQNRTKRDSSHGRILSQPRHRLHLFVRASKRRPNGAAAPFVYCGQVRFGNWTGDQPIEVEWRLPQPLPEHLHRVFGVPSG